MANTTVRDIILAAAMAEADTIHLRRRRSLSPCSRLAALLLASPVLCPVLLPASEGISSTYGGALAASGLVLVGCAAAGMAVILVLAHAAKDSVTNRLSQAATSARFPATTLQCFIFLAPGASVACGLSMAEGFATAGLSFVVLQGASHKNCCVEMAGGVGAEVNSPPR